jgi:hypothetical protein
VLDCFEKDNENKRERLLDFIFVLLDSPELFFRAFKLFEKKIEQ